MLLLATRRETMKLEPLNDRVVIKQKDADNMTKGGLHLPEQTKEKPTSGTVVAVGPGKVNESSNLISLNVKVGDEVLYERYGGSEVEVDGEKFVVVRENEIIAIFIGLKTFQFESEVLKRVSNQEVISNSQTCRFV